MRVILVLILFLCACAAPRPASPHAMRGLPKIEAKTAALRAQGGLLPVYLDDAAGKVFVRIPAADERGLCVELLYVEGLLQGMGSNPVGLDRGQLGAAVVLRLRRLGRRVLFEQPNLGYRAISESRDERRAVAESFATSVLWATELVAEDPDGSGLIELTDFLLRDAHDVVDRLRSTRQGSFKLDAKRSFVDTAAALAFPDNIEFESILTFAGDQPGPLVRSTTPTADALTLTVHHSFVRLPEPGYEPRAFDPRMGSHGIQFLDYAAPLEAPLEKRWIARHRLEKSDPSRTSSPVKEPIVYYLDRGAPEPVRSALLEGASWWAKAFEAAGFENAYRVEVLPEGAHPLDVRYNVIQWVHRSTRGWSYGNSIVDPRTGEIIKGHVSLGSLRVRQDRLIFEGLLGAADSGSGGPTDPVQLALARLRQLSAHEVGHTIGLAHNFAASSYGDRESVMDYPAPRVHLRDGEPDLAGVYGVGVGDWDEWAIRWAYAEFADGVDEAAELERIVQEGRRAGLQFLTENDSRPLGTAVSGSSLWDNGSDATAELREVVAMRAHALERFGLRNVSSGQPVALLQETFVPLYLHHRYQLEAAAKAIGGAHYRYAVAGEEDVAQRPVAAAAQREALDVALATIEPRFLDISEATLGLLLPRPFGYETHDELFSGRTAPIFDPMDAAATSADWTLAQLLDAGRLARVFDQGRRDPGQLSLPELLRAVRERCFADDTDARAARLRELTQRLLVDRLVALSASAATAQHVRALAEAELRTIAGELEARRSDPVAGAHRATLRSDIERYLDEREYSPTRNFDPAAMPPGSPIGCGG